VATGPQLSEDGGYITIAERRSEEEHRTCVPEGLACFYWSISMQVPLAHKPALSAIRGWRSNHIESKEMQLDGYSYQSKSNRLVTGALGPLHWGFGYSFL